jgi:elongation factor 1-gamma
MAQLRIFSYLPNPRIWKATIAARLNGVEVEVRGARPRELRDWLWDFEARPLAPAERTELAASVRVGKIGFKGGELIKTDAFLAAHPFGTVPAAFSPDGQTGIFESNSIMRTVARLGAERVPLYGRDAYEASRIDSFLDASLVFARDVQHYLLAFGDESFPAHVHARAADAFAVYIAGIEQALAPQREFLVGEQITAGRHSTSAGSRRSCPMTGSRPAPGPAHTSGALRTIRPLRPMSGPICRRSRLDSPTTSVGEPDHRDQDRRVDSPAELEGEWSPLRSDLG